MLGAGSRRSRTAICCCGSPPTPTPLTCSPGATSPRSRRSRDARPRRPGDAPGLAGPRRRRPDRHLLIGYPGRPPCRRAAAGRRRRAGRGLDLPGRGQARGAGNGAGCCRPRRLGARAVASVVR
ncbi:MAG: hypothetical protein MZW92_10665 [Comamonadaceae bacterium]|nr:hypothetical protein [Comamonadaceae bacterium]